MNPIKNILVIISLILILNACEKKAKHISELVAVDSLGWDEDNEEHFINGPSFKLVKDKLFVTVTAADTKIKVYSTKDFDFITSFGSKGYGPGEFIGISGIEIFNDTIFVCSPGNKRISKFNKQYNYISAIKMTNWNLNKFENKLYADTFLFNGIRKVFEYQNYDFIEKYDIEEIFAEVFKQKYSLNEFLVFNENPIFILYKYDDRYSSLYSISKELKPIFLDFNKEFRNQGFDFILDFVVVNDKLLLLANKTGIKVDSKLEFKDSVHYREKFNIEQYVLTLDSNFQIIKKELVPKNIHSFIIESNGMEHFLKDQNSSVIYKLRSSNSSR